VKFVDSVAVTPARRSCFLAESPIAAQIVVQQAL
jgi:hypothetical protein